MNATTNQELAISTQGLTRRFRDVLAVDQMELEVPAGGVFGFLGPNGAGKSTFIRLLLGLLRADSGSVHIFGRRLQRHKHHEVLASVGALVENPSLYDHLHGRENLEVTRRLLGLPKSRVDQVLTTVNLQSAADRPAGTYSLGMRQRLGVALALLAEPSLLILDEPTNGLDPAGIREMRNLLRQLAGEQGITVFLSSHLLQEVEQIADRVAVVRQGRLLFQGRVENLSTVEAQVIVGTDAPNEAKAVLGQAGYSVSQSLTDERLQVAAQGRESAAAVCRHLVEAGIGVHHLSQRTSSLEDAFLELTEPAIAQTSEEGPTVTEGVGQDPQPGGAR